MEEEFKLPKLYGVAKSGKVKQWTVEVDFSKRYPAIVTVFGYIDGAQRTDRRDIKVGKNIGKSNETTVDEQARLVAQSAWTKKKDKNYQITFPIPGEFIKLPMLALEFAERGHGIKFPCYAQAKLNGVRCLAENHGTSIGLTSRGGKPFNMLSHLQEFMEQMILPDETIDGELYNHDLTFQEIVSAVKREKDVNPNTAKIEYHVYDLADPDMDFEKRVEILYQKIPNMEGVPIKRVSTKWIDNMDELNEFHEDNIAQGYEGTMVRNLKGGYLFQYRSENLQKIKDFLDAEFKIIDGKQGEGSAEGQCIFRCITDDGKEFDVRTIGTAERREEQWDNLPSYISKYLTVKYQNLSDEGVPIFPVGLEIRSGYMGQDGTFVPDM